MEEEEDRILLSSLGVTSANPEDIGRDILAKAENNAGNGREVGGITEEEPSDKPEGNDPSSTANQAKLLNKLRAVEFEIDAVASTVEERKDIAAGDEGVKDEPFEEGDRENDESATKLSSCGSTLQHALATDRLKSLKNTKAQLEKQLSGLFKENPSEGIKHDKLLKDLVKEEPKLKRKSKETQKPSKDQGKRKKTVSFNDDVDFDAVLDAASAGFMETERDELVRKGILTPFISLRDLSAVFNSLVHLMSLCLMKKMRMMISFPLVLLELRSQYQRLQKSVHQRNCLILMLCQSLMMHPLFLFKD